MTEAKTYWEKRCIINENMLYAVTLLIGDTLPHTQEMIDALFEKWNDATEQIEEEFGNE